MADSEHIEVAKAYVTIVPSMEGSQKIIAEELGASGKDAAKSAGEETGKELGNSIATGLKATAAVIAGAMAAVAGAAVAAGKAFIDSANDVAAWGDQVDKESQKMNMSAAGYQEWSFILEHAGASIEGMKNSMKKLTVAAEEGNDAFTALGISQEQLASMTPEETWNATIAALQNVADEGERTALASELLGKGAVELAPLFNMTAEETAALKDQVYELGGVMSDDAVKAAAEYQDQLQNMQTSLKGLKNNIMSQFLPGLSSVMSGLGKLFSGNGGLEEIRAGLADITSNLADLAPQFVELASAIVMSLLDAFGPVLPELLTGIFNFLNEALNGLVALIPSLLPVITQAITSLMQTVFQCLPLITSSLITLITDLVTWLASGDNVKTFSNGIVQLVTALVKQIGMVLPILLPAIVSIISDVATTITTPENIALILDAVLLVVGAVVQALANSIPEFVNYIVGLVTNIKNNILQFLNWINPALAQNFNNNLNALMNFGSNVKNFITNLISNIISGVTSFLARLQAGFTSAFASVQAWVGNIVGNIQGFVASCLAALTSLPSSVVSIGENLVKGLWNGISDKVDWVCEKIKGMGKQIEKAIKKVFGIASPSKVFAEIGDYLAQGLGVGFEDGMQDVNADMVGQMEDLTGSMSAEVNAYGVGSSASVGDTTTYHGGPVTMNIYGAEGQDVYALADVIAEKLEDIKKQKEAVYGV
jgi:phage-related protein